MELRQIEKELSDWHLRKYGRRDVDMGATIRKLGEEFGELMEAIHRGEPRPIAEEAADVLFVMTHVVRQACGATGCLEAAAVHKIEVVNMRIEEAATNER